MKRIIYFAGLFLLILIVSPFFLLAGNENKDLNPDIAIRQVEDRKEATFSGTPAAAVAESPAKRAAIKKTLKVVEDNTADVTEKSSNLIGKGTDKTVHTVEKGGDSIFSWSVKWVDSFFKQKKTKK
ncbi:MAG: hypothetical protein A3G33_07185 [Omnitrophica bacterium RIFCSPLOWO2_12_FULL_44_17]|uniref:Uncharacterized protein n=1 Tax=Candidatus Danuiimicrobium aquiferis TaxID=1801832 RepID=A0A1G1KYM6_9BACT|nr:MAG: hypothetical protein A3B72_07480 [Omnitrophica bacterium RIFCSPHIGHO2_02_FULL_45_28]OGW90389.1 MAG: hypothetical protein A3E74_07220 [Omnitrophica bacterium RIFCSPHIGHO2_12_FULL_44_12]OGW98010.1 MAG: hypothetical protein A3G33_07185 [Omnitrophica bacterium RIFCSPLOWO2_12_FULL_44_17]OGX03545.1 MAG: hypothetical protein A3J12_03045 [Omnitrophica bacterium RIFCSPLOWO2_02_FULL_44_11]